MVLNFFYPQDTQEEPKIQRKRYKSHRSTVSTFRVSNHRAKKRATPEAPIVRTATRNVPSMELDQDGSVTLAITCQLPWHPPTEIIIRTSLLLVVLLLLLARN